MRQRAPQLGLEAGEGVRDRARRRPGRAPGRAAAGRRDPAGRPQCRSAVGRAASIAHWRACRPGDTRRCCWSQRGGSSRYIAVHASGGRTAVVPAPASSPRARPACRAAAVRRCRRLCDNGRAFRQRPRAARHAAHPQLLHHRPRRPRQVDAGRPHHPALRRPRGARDGSAGARLQPDRARARHHHQGAVGLAAVHGEGRHRPTSSTSSTRPATSTSATKSRARSPPAKARCWWSMRRRASRRSRSPTATPRSSRAWKWCRCSTRSTCRPPTSRRSRRRSRR